MLGGSKRQVGKIMRKLLIEEQLAEQLEVQEQLNRDKLLRKTEQYKKVVEQQMQQYRETLNQSTSSSFQSSSFVLQYSLQENENTVVINHEYLRNLENEVRLLREELNTTQRMVIVYQSEAEALRGAITRPQTAPPPQTNLVDGFQRQQMIDKLYK